MSSEAYKKETEPAINLEKISKIYQMYAKPSDRLKQMFWRSRRKLFRDFVALNQVSLNIKKGETVGIIGRNGSGKSTLLQIICGTLQATSGKMNINGRIAALLELGAGFNPEFTGRENVHLNSALLGLDQKDTDANFENIIDFADIGSFIDQPVKTYSSGMYVRLAFAVAIHANPDILVIDEALSVGDEAFRRKCFARIDQLQKRGTTILFVSHSAQSIIQLCSHAILLDAGEIILEGEPKYVVNQYQKMMNLSGEKAASERAKIIESNKSQEKDTPKNEEEKNQDHLEGFDPSLQSSSKLEYESKGAIISNVRILSETGKPANILQTGKQYHYEYDVEFTQPAKNIGFGALVKSTHGYEFGGANTQYSKTMCLPSVEAMQRITVRFTFTCRFVQGVYFFNAGVGSLDEGDFSYLHRIVDAYAFKIAPEPQDLLYGKIDLDFDVSINEIDKL